jgi:thioredoxin reductase (NADPH)
MENIYDVIIVGSGPAGLTAAIYCTRANLKTLVIAGFKWGGQLQLTTEVENFPGFEEGVQGPDLMLKMRKQAERFGAEIIDKNMDPTDFSSMSGGPFKVSAEGQTYEGKALLIATGADSKTLDVMGEKELSGHGVSYCATCDGAFFRNKKIIVAGGGDSAMEEACFLTHFGETVTIVHRREEFRASKIMIEKAKKNPKIKFLLNSQITQIVGQNKVEAIKIKDTKTGVESQVPADAVFVAIGHLPNSSVFKGVELKDTGYVRAQDGTHTNIEGIFVSGDVEDDRYRQAVTAAGFGCQAALDIEKWLREK